MVRDALTLEDIIKCRRALDSAPTPRFNRFTSEYRERVKEDSMTDTKKDLATETLEKLYKNAYTTAGGILVGANNYTKTMVIATNPLLDDISNCIYLSASDIEELFRLQKLLTAADKKDNAESSMRSASYVLADSQEKENKYGF